MPFPSGRAADRGPHPAARAVFGVAFLATLLISVRLISGGASTSPTLAGTKAPVHGGFGEVTRPSVLKPLAPMTRRPRATRNASDGSTPPKKVWTTLATPHIEEPLQRLPTWRPPAVAAADAAKGQRIPRVMYTTWKTNVLPPRARELMAVWRWREPDWSWRTLSDRECDTLVQPYPDLRDAYRALKMPVMRADICRMLILYAYGGAYRDLDVAWVEPLSTWLNLSMPIVFGREDGPHLCQWFLAAEPRNPCIGHAIDVITELIADVDFDFERNPELVIDSTGPGAFTKAMELCPTKEALTIDDMTKAKVKHEFAAMNWRSEKHGYASWLEQRRNMMGWVDIFHNSDADRFVKGYLFRPSGELLAPLEAAKPALHVVVWQTSHRFGEKLHYFPASHAVDRNLDTYSMTENFGVQAWVLQPDPGHHPAGVFDVSCVRVWNKRRLHDAEFFEEFALEVLPTRGDWETVFPPPSGGADTKGFGSRTGSASFMVRVAELTRPGRTVVSVKGIRIVKNDPAKAERKTILLGEVEIFADDGACIKARAVKARVEVESLPPPPPDGQDRRWVAATEMMLADLRRPREVRCENTVGVSGEWGSQHALCVDAMEQSRKNSRDKDVPIRVVVVTDFGRLDAMFARTMQQRLNCRIEVFTSQPFKLQDSAPPNTRLIRLVSLQAKDEGKVPVPVTRHGEQKSDVPPALSVFEITLVPAALVLLDAGPRNWELLEDAVTAAAGGRIDALMTELCLQPELLGVEATLSGTQAIHARIRSLLEGYAMLWWDVAPHTSITSQGAVDFPACVQLSLVRRGLLPSSG